MRCYVLVSFHFFFIKKCLPSINNLYKCNFSTHIVFLGLCSTSDSIFTGRIVCVPYTLGKLPQITFFFITNTIVGIKNARYQPKKISVQFQELLIFFLNTYLLLPQISLTFLLIFVTNYHIIYNLRLFGFSWIF